MDVLTTRGQKTLEQEKEAIGIWRANYPDITYNHTPKDSPADIDAILTGRDNRIVGVVETKCRVSMSLEEFLDTYDSMWLVTYSKITSGINISKALQVPFVGFLYFPREKTLLVKSIYCPRDGVKARMEIKHTTTQKTVNGGKIMRDNAYIDMSNARRLT